MRHRQGRFGTMLHVAVASIVGASMLVACDDGGDSTGATTEPPSSIDGPSTSGEGDATTVVPDDSVTTNDSTVDSGSTVDGPDDEGNRGDEEGRGGTVVYGTAGEFRSLNNNLAGTRSASNAVVTSAVLPDAMPYDPTKGDNVADRELMKSVELVSTDPQIVEYVVDPDAAWSDGEPIDCDDWYLEWIAANGTLVQQRRNGKPKENPATGEPLLLFDPASVSGYEDIDRLTCADDGKTVTARYATPYAGWRTLFTDMIPAHVVERDANVDDLVAAYDDSDRDALEALAEQYTTIFTPQPGRLDPQIFLSGDTFAIGDWQPGETLTLVPNEHYWGRAPKLDTVVVRQVPDELQLQALANDEIDVMDRWPEANLVANLDGLDNVIVETGRQFRWEHYVFNLRADSPFADERVRQAFALCLPRDRMLATVVKPVLPDGTLLNNRLIQDFEPGYRDTSKGRYDVTDIDESKSLLRRADVTTPVRVQLGWNLDGSDLRRAYQVAAAIRGCKRAGFEVEDVGDPSFVRDSLDDGESWDVAMLTRVADPSMSDAADVYGTDGVDNVGRYSNRRVDRLLGRLTGELDHRRAVTIANEIDALMWQDLPTIPLYSRPAIAAWNERVQGVVLNQAQNDILWNAETWSIID